MTEARYWHTNVLDFHPNRPPAGEKYPFEYWHEIPVGSMWQIKDLDTLRTSNQYMMAFDIVTGGEIRKPQMKIPQGPMMFMGLVKSHDHQEYGLGSADTPSVYHTAWFYDAHYWKTVMIWHDIRDFFWRWTMVSK